MVDSEGTVKLMDMGMWRVTAAHVRLNNELEANRPWPEKNAWKAPELLDAEELGFFMEPTCMSDVYAFAITCIEVSDSVV